MAPQTLLKDLSPAECVKALRAFDEEARVTIVVKDESYNMPKKLACSSSSYFDRVFNNGFRETADLKVQLEDVEKEHFDLVMQWIYTGSVDFDFEPPLTPSSKHLFTPAFSSLRIGLISVGVSSCCTAR
ncbi:POZ [Glarea lozoyensis ATCC 20868]|uniref:POZ n=1 Tax=Glarea lozoyensis (strain ATCC 20868 / MF5171) TaxID=1116229 RepID=S3CTI2_GLAL2|nr:POZ [Glarea lozoyensis ATCC 20868]EPE28970.1 POZ [Glarea lozoyensis ATCC 20868]